MKELTHHNYVSPFKSDYLSRTSVFWTGTFVDAIRSGRGAFASAPRDLLEVAGLSYFQKAYLEVQRYLSLAAEVGAIGCALSFRTGDVSVTYNGATIVAVGSVPTMPASPSDWVVSCFDFVLLARRRELLDLVLEYPADYLRRANGERDEYSFTLVETLRAFTRGQANWKDLAVETERNMEPDRATIAPANWVAMDRARIGVLRAIDQGTKEALDAALIVMIKAHKAVYGRGQEVKNPGGLLCMPALALGALAHDRGIRTTVVSDYMPLWLLRGEDPPA